MLCSLLRYDGKSGSGAVVEFRVKEGPITMLSIGLSREGRFKFVIAEGRSQRGSIPATGNTNTLGVFLPDVRTFLQRWVSEEPTHQFAPGAGRHARTLQGIAEILGVESVIVAQEGTTERT